MLKAPSMEAVGADGEPWNGLIVKDRICFSQVFYPLALWPVALCSPWDVASPYSRIRTSPSCRQAHLAVPARHTSRKRQSRWVFAVRLPHSGNIVGIYTDASGNGHGFLFNGAYTPFDYPGASFTEATGINPGGVIVGLYVDSANAVHGFIRTP